jgi:DNA-binding NarL/FixJ family response regulator
MQEKITVLVLCWKEQDSQCIQDSLAVIKNLHIVSVEMDITSAILKTAALKPNVLLIGLPATNLWGVDITAIIRRRSPETTIAVICESEEGDYAEKALSAGIRGLFLKREDMDKLAMAVQLIYLGGYFINASIASRTICANKKSCEEFYNFRQWDKKGGNVSQPLNRLQLNIIAKMAEGCTDEEISKKLHISKGTIRNYISEIRYKTKLSTRTEIVLYSLANGLIKREPAAD